MVTTQDGALAHQLRMLRSHGVTRDAADMTGPVEGAWYYEQQVLGYNYRMTDVQAALGCSQLTRLPTFHRRRIELAQRYDALLRELPLLRPAVLSDRVSSLHLYAVEIDSSKGNPWGHPRAAHSVLTEHLVDEPGQPTQDALHQVLDFFDERLGTASTAG